MKKVEKKKTLTELKLVRWDSDFDETQVCFYCSPLSGMASSFVLLVFVSCWFCWLTIPRWRLAFEFAGWRGEADDGV